MQEAVALLEFVSCPTLHRDYRLDDHDLVVIFSSLGMAWAVDEMSATAQEFLSCHPHSRIVGRVSVFPLSSVKYLKGSNDEFHVYLDEVIMKVQRR